MEGQQNICGYATIETECKTHKINEIGVLDFQLKFIEQLDQLYKSVSKPKIEVGFFVLPEGAQLGVGIIPATISNLHLYQQPHEISLRLLLSTSQTVKTLAYGEVLNLAKLSVNFIDILSKRLGLTYSTNLGITNSDTSTLTVTLRKTI